MLIFNEEKQYLQQRYVRKIQEANHRLAELIERDESDAVAECVGQIKEWSARITWLDKTFQQDLKNCMNEAERK